MTVVDAKRRRLAWRVAQPLHRTPFSFSETAVQRTALTQKFVREIAPPSKGRLYIADSKVPHLSLCITSAGTRTYYRTGRIAGKPKRIRLGTIDELTVDAARKACAELTGKVAGGNDPTAERRQRRTLGDLWRWYFEHHSRPHKDTWQQDERRWNRVYAGWANRYLTDIRTEDVQKVVTEVGSKRGPYAGNKARELLRHMFSIAVSIGWAPSNPATAVKRFKTVERERYLQPSEVGRFFAHLEQCRQPSKDFFKLCLFTGARRGNVGAMQWGHVDLDGGLWSIPGDDMKENSAVVIVLPSPAVMVLRTRLNVRKGDSPFVFPSNSKLGHYRWPKTAWQSLLAAADIEDLRIHDLRRTLGSWQANMNVPLNIIGQSLSHKSLASTQIYARLQVDPVRASVEAAVAAVLETAEKNLKIAPGPQSLRKASAPSRKAP